MYQHLILLTMDYVTALITCLQSWKCSILM